jgi:tetratricopeptide (TPR) repeat protein
MALNQTGRYEEAVQSFDNVLERDPGQLRALNDKEKALKAMECILESNVAYWLRKGDDLRSQFLVESYMMTNVSNNVSNNTVLASCPGNASTWLGKNEESVRAYEMVLEIANRTLEIDPGDAEAWKEKGAALASLGLGEASNESYQKAVDLYNQSIEKDPKNASIWWLKAETLDLMGRSTSALQAFDKVIELNSSKAAAAWIRKSDIYLFMNDQNQSAQAFDTAVILMDNDTRGPSSLARLNASDDQFVAMWSGDHNKDITCSQRDNHTGYSVVGWKDGNATLRISTWWYKGQILRVSFNRYNESIKSFDLYMQVDSHIIDSWRDKSLSVESRLRDHQRVIEALGRKSWGKAVSAKAEETGQI